MSTNKSIVEAYFQSFTNDESNNAANTNKFVSSDIILTINGEYGRINKIKHNDVMSNDVITNIINNINSSNHKAKL